jgi:hypothetical protein
MIYTVDPSVSDQSSPSDPKSVKSIIDSLGPNPATLLFEHKFGLATPYIFQSNMTIPNNILLRFENGACFHLLANVVVRVAGYIDAGLHKIFDVHPTAELSAIRDKSAITLVNSTVYPEWWGAAGDAFIDIGTPPWEATGTNDYLPLQQAIKYYRHQAVGAGVDLYGGAVELQSGMQYLIEDSNLEVYEHVRIGGKLGRDGMRMGAVGPGIMFNTNDGAYTINLWQGSSLDGISVLGSEIQGTGHQYTSEVDWPGTGITMYSEGSQGCQSIDNCFIGGFNLGIKSYGGGSQWIQNTNFDCVNGLDIRGHGNPVFLNNIQMFSYLTMGLNGLSNERPGTGMYFDDMDGLILSNIFIRNFRTQLEVRATTGPSWGVEMSNIFSEGNLEYDSGKTYYGIVLGNKNSPEPESISARLVNCSMHMGAKAGGSYDYYINTSDSFYEKVHMTNCTANSAIQGIYVALNSAKPVITNCTADNCVSYAIHAQGKYSYPNGTTLFTGDKMFLDSLWVGCGGDYGSLNAKALIHGGPDNGTSLMVNTYESSGNAITFYSHVKANPNVAGTITLNGGTAAYNTSSDRNLKENIIQTEKGLETLKSIPVRDFNFKNDKDKIKRQGLIAQELVNIYPEAVHVGSDEKDPWSIDYGKLTPLLISSVQDLTALVEKLTDRIDELET